MNKEDKADLEVLMKMYIRDNTDLTKVGRNKLIKLLLLERDEREDK